MKFKVGDKLISLTTTQKRSKGDIVEVVRVRSDNSFDYFNQKNGEVVPTYRLQDFKLAPSAKIEPLKRLPKWW